MFATDSRGRLMINEGLTEKESSRSSLTDAMAEEEVYIHYTQAYDACKRMIRSCYFVILV